MAPIFIFNESRKNSINLLKVTLKLQSTFNNLAINTYKINIKLCLLAFFTFTNNIDRVINKYSNTETRISTTSKNMSSNYIKRNNLHMYKSSHLFKYCPVNTKHILREIIKLRRTTICYMYEIQPYSSCSDSIPWYTRINLGYTGV